MFSDRARSAPTIFQSSSLDAILHASDLPTAVAVSTITSHEAGFGRVFPRRMEALNELNSRGSAPKNQQGCFFIHYTLLIRSTKVKVSRYRPRWPMRLRPRIFLTFRHYKGDRSSAKRTGRLYLSRNPWYSLSEAESTSGHMVLSGVPRKKSPVTPPGIDPGTVLLVAQRFNHYATLGPTPC